MQALFDLAARQHGLFTRQQAREIGVADADVRRWQREGIAVAEGRRVLRVTAAPTSWHQRVLAACLRAGDECIASHRTAAVLHGLDGARTGIVEVTIPHQSSFRCDGVRVHRTRSLDGVDRTRVGPIPVTTVARTLIDLGAVAGLEFVEEALDSAQRDRKTNVRSLQARFASLHAPGRNGIAIARILITDRGETIPHSVLERRFLRLLERSGVPSPALQHPVRLPNGHFIYIDAAYVERRLGFELDGHRWHATRAQRAADNRRADALSRLGWDIRRFTYEQVVADSPAVVRSVRCALEPPLGSFSADTA